MISNKTLLMDKYVVTRLKSPVMLKRELVTTIKQEIIAMISRAMSSEFLKTVTGFSGTVFMI